MVIIYNILIQLKRINKLPGLSTFFIIKKLFLFYSQHNIVNMMVKCFLRPSNHDI